MQTRDSEAHDGPLPLEPIAASVAPRKTRGVRITTSDGFALDATVCEPEGAPLATVMVSSGTAIRKEFYLKFALHLARRGYLAIVYDYRGVGGSRPRSLRGFSAQMREWGEKDMTAVLNWLEATYPGLPKHLVAHSMGGQLVGLMPNHALLESIVTVSTSIGYWKEMTSAPFRLFCGFMWNVYVPLTSRLFGYIPIRILRQGEDLPAGVGREWAAWCNEPEYLLPFFGKSIEHNYYCQVRTPITAFAFTDDKIANRQTVPRMMRFYENAPVEVRFIAPHEVGLRSIGHFGFFSSRSSKLWDQAIEAMKHPPPLRSEVSALRHSN